MLKVYNKDSCAHCKHRSDEKWISAYGTDIYLCTKGAERVTLHQDACADFELDEEKLKKSMQDFKYFLNEQYGGTDEV